MKNTITSVGLALFAVPLLVAPSLAAAGPSNDDVARSYGTRAAVTLKSGFMRLDDRTQTLGGVDREFNDKVRNKFVIEGESRFERYGDLVLGGELMWYRNAFKRADNSLPNNPNNMWAYGLFVKPKYFFPVSRSWQPYVGAGLGYMEAADDYGPIAGGARGGAQQLVAGMQWRADRVGLRLEYMQLRAKLEDRAGQEVDASTHGVLLGVTFHFLHK
jgi:opacity protein-like surface antigen